MALAVLLGAAVWVRLGSYQSSEDVTRAPAVTHSATATSANANATGTIVEISESPIDGAAPSTTNTNGSASAREQRYNELLRSTPPQAPQTVSSIAPPQETKPPSLLDRVASVLGMKPKPAPTPQPQPQQPAPRPQPQASNDSPGQQQQKTDTTNTDNDPDADVIAPQLMAAEFVPPQVADGESTQFAVIVQDNLSGVRSVSGVIASPSGAMQGFACQREGDSSRYVTRINIPKEAASGTWQVKYLTLMDNASNSVNLNQSSGLPGSASFRVVSSTSDSTGPVLKSVWLDRMSMEAGERNTLFVQAEDDHAGISIVSGVFVSPSKSARLGFGCRAGTTGAWECPLTPPKCLDCGAWKLEQVQLQDKANNLTTVRADNALINNIAVAISSDACDSEPPRLTSLTLSPTVVSNMEDSEIEVRAMITDEGCGVASLSGQAIPPGGIGGQRAYFSLEPAGDGQMFVGKMIIKKSAASGVWTVNWLQALDKGHNLKPYPANDPVVSRVTFRVE